MERPLSYIIFRIGWRLLLPFIILLYGFTSYLINDISSTDNNNILAWHELRKTFKLKDSSSEKIVLQQINHLVDNQNYLETLAKNSTPFLHYILNHVKERKLPGEIALIPMLESNFNPFLYSRVGAAGLWQLMPKTAKHLGLNKSQWYDERRDLILSTQAALEYFEYLYNYFEGNWLYAIAAYNSGAWTVVSAINNNKKAGLSTNLWALKLPSETKRFVARLLALVTIIKNPKAYGIDLPDLSTKPYFDVVTFQEPLDLAICAQLAEIKYSELHTLNAGFMHKKGSSNELYQLLLPIHKRDNFYSNYERHQAQLQTISSQTNYIKYKVGKGDTISELAKKYHVSVKQLKELNHLTSYTLIAGKSILIPVPTSMAEVNIKLNSSPRLNKYSFHQDNTILDIPDYVKNKESSKAYWPHLKSNDPKKLASESKMLDDESQTVAYHVVQNGETLSHIAKRYNRSLQDLKALNQLPNHTIKIGQKLVV